MTRKVQEIALSFFLAVCGISVLMGMLWLKPVIESQRLLIEETRINQENIRKDAEKTKAILTELGYAVAVIAMEEKGMIQAADANKMIEESVHTIDTHSERLGKLANILNEFRINQQAKR